MKRIAVFCVTYHSDRELEQYLTSLRRAQEYAGEKVGLDIFVGRNTDEDNPGYFGAVRRLMTGVEVKNYDYVIVSNVDLTVEVDFLTKLADYDCAGDTGWIAPQIYSSYEDRDRNPGRMHRLSLNALRILKTVYRFPFLDTLYRHTLYRRKRYQHHEAGTIYAGHGSFIILTRNYLERCGTIDYPVFLFCEEIYLAEMCRRNGLTVVYAPHMKVNDTEHVSVGQMSHSTYCRHNFEAVSYIIRHFY